jgi:hypothetical protein
VSTFGPAYDERVDGQRLKTQRDHIRDVMLGVDQHLSLQQIAAMTGYPEASVSAQLRHLRKPRFGGYRVLKRRRADDGGTWEYRVLPKEEL